jgi:hypothetical protein
MYLFRRKFAYPGGGRGVAVRVYRPPRPAPTPFSYSDIQANFNNSIIAYKKDIQKINVLIIWTKVCSLPFRFHVM